ncbi:hypothetical protein CHISP_2701 [Chitinispirillum alkaliphilum]|nr:hypothetical protein CHISP_2701 [Chitinispirillum alkaliphilum]
MLVIGFFVNMSGAQVLQEEIAEESSGDPRENVYQESISYPEITAADTIRMNVSFVGYRFYLGDKRLTFGELERTVKSNRQAYSEINTAARTNVLTGIVGGLALIPLLLSFDVLTGEPNWVRIGIGTAGIAATIPLKRRFLRQTQEAVNTYNTGLRTASVFKSDESEMAHFTQPLSPEDCLPANEFRSIRTLHHGEKQFHTSMNKLSEQYSFITHPQILKNLLYTEAMSDGLFLYNGLDSLILDKCLLSGRLAEHDFKGDLFESRNALLRINRYARNEVTFMTLSGVSFALGCAATIIGAMVLWGNDDPSWIRAGLVSIGAGGLFSITHFYFLIRSSIEIEKFFRNHNSSTLMCTY